MTVVSEKGHKLLLCDIKKWVRWVRCNQGVREIREERDFMEKAVIALKVKSDKNGIRTAIYQACQLCVEALKNDVQVVECIVTFGGVKDILREVKAIDAKGRFDTLLIYSPSQICKSGAEYIEFENFMAECFKIQIQYLRSGV